MSTHDNERRELDDVLTAYLASGAMDSDSLERWIQRYPEYTHELTDFAVARTLSDSMPIDPDSAQVTDSTLVERSLLVVNELLAKKEQVEPAGALAGSSGAQRLSGLM